MASLDLNAFETRRREKMNTKINTQKLKTWLMEQISEVQNTERKRWDNPILMDGYLAALESVAQKLDSLENEK
jgi:hypothetical protein